MYSGVFTALVTPLHESGDIDFDTLGQIVDDQIEKGISGLVPMGTTGESPTIDSVEHIQVIEAVINKSNSRVPVVAGTGSNSTQEAINLTKEAEQCGADASLQVSPYYNKPSQQGLYYHFKTIADSVDIPIILYNVPGRTGRAIEPATILKLSEHPNIIGIKEASGNIPGIMEIIQNKPKDFFVFSGDDNMTYPILSLGGTGVISVASNIVPDRMEQMVQEALKGNILEAQKLHYKLLPLFQGMFLDTNPVPVKCAMSLMKIIKESYRLPLVPMSEEKKNRLKEILKDLNIM